MNQLICSFLDVGQGDGTLFSIPVGKKNGYFVYQFVLIDLGSTKGAKITRPELETLLFNHFKIKELELLVLTHPDSDHYNLIYMLLDHNVTFKKIIYGGHWSDYLENANATCNCKSNGKDKKTTIGKKIIIKKNSLHIFGKCDTCDSDYVYDEGNYELSNTYKFENSWYDGINDGSIEALGPNCFGGEYTFSGCKFSLMAANVGMVNNDDKKDSREEYEKNQASLVLRVSYKGYSIMMTGDATYQTERFILTNHSNDSNTSTLTSNVLKVAHHGSAGTSTSKEWVEAVDPEWAFISSDRFGTTDPEKKKDTGHRLPRAEAIESILQFAETIKTEHDGEDHIYTAYYSREEAGLFGKSRSYSSWNQGAKETDPSALKDQTIPLDSKRPKGAFVEIKTKRRIFTTLCRLDYPDDNDQKKEKDIGTRYDLYIDANGIALEITAKDEITNFSYGDRFNEEEIYWFHDKE